MHRWFVTLQNYDVTFEYITGKKNIAADALSRNIISGSSENEVNSVVCSVQELITLDSDMIAVEQSKDETWHDLIQYIKNPTQTGQPPKLLGTCKVNEFQLLNGLLYRNTEVVSRGVSRGKVRQLIIPKKLVKDTLKLIHDSTPSSHPGKDKTYKQAQVFLAEHATGNLFLCRQLYNLC